MRSGPAWDLEWGEGPPTIFMCLVIRTTYACHLVIFISEEISLFEDSIKLSIVQTTVFHLNIV